MTLKRRSFEGTTPANTREWGGGQLVHVSQQSRSGPAGCCPLFSSVRWVAVCCQWRA